MGAYRRLDRAFTDAPVLPLTKDSRFILFSDCHRGCGNSSDNLLKNQHLYFAALQYYYDRDFTYIELGDGDELWENRSYQAIKEIHNDIFWILSRYYAKDRLFMLYGNHDMVKKYGRFSKRHCSCYPCSNCKEEDLFPGITFYSGLILKNQWMSRACSESADSGSAPSGRDLYLTHGHQADLLNSVLWRLSRFLVRYVWKPLEQMGVQDPTSAARNYSRKKRTEQILSDWAAANGCTLICGHTHRPMLDGASSYYNTGSCVHPRCITCIEIEGLHATLVKWSMSARPDRTLYVAREELTEPVRL